MKNKGEYLNFPISFFKDPFLEVKGTIDNAIDYAIYRHSLNLDEGSITDKIKAAANFFSISLGSVKDVKPNYNEIVEKYNIAAPNVSLRMDPIMWDYYKNDKKEFQIACFRAFCAIKSILGGADTVVTNKEMILARMFGMSKPNEEIRQLFIDNRDPQNVVLVSKSAAHQYFLSEGYEIELISVAHAIRDGEIPSEQVKGECRIKRTDLVRYAKRNRLKKRENLTNNMYLRKYANRHHIDKVLTELQLYWGLNSQASEGMRGFRLSFKIQLEELSMINEQRKRKNKVDQLKQRKREAAENAKRAYGNE